MYIRLDQLRSRFLWSNSSSNPPVLGFEDEDPPLTITNIRSANFRVGSNGFFEWVGLRFCVETPNFGFELITQVSVLILSSSFLKKKKKLYLAEEGVVAFAKSFLFLYIFFIKKLFELALNFLY